jgi:GNAT superfamily N-acetyltransferase
MSMIDIVEREMTQAEFDRMNAGFDEHGTEFGNPPVPQLRYGFVATDAGTFVGCATGITDGNGTWFYLTDLFVEKPFRGRGLGSALLRALECRVAALGVRRIWTWTAGYGAPGFYAKQGYQILCQMDNWYASGHARVGLWKSLPPPARAP